MSEKVVLRFAPSPTGPLHMGGVRTALYNYLFAKQTGGTLILRIEDTDQTRLVPGADQYIIDALAWCGITFDEGVHVGGPSAPYRQSERAAIYQKYTEQLIASGHAYLAFDTAEELDAAREKQGTHFSYNYQTRMDMQNSLSLSAEAVAAKKAAGEPYVVRMKVPEDEEVVFQDIVREEVRFHTSQMDDKVLMKSDGLPTYHLANIVDDHLMGITHVIRGEEWLPSTPLHVLLYRAFGWEAIMPKFVHLPLILKPDPALVTRNKGTRRELTDKLSDEFMAAHPALDQKIRSKVHSFIQQLFSDRQGIQARLNPKDNEPNYQKWLKTFLKGALFGKLSKRDGDRLGFPVFPMDWQDPKTGDTSAGYREAGYLPQAFLNALALLGWNPGNDEEIMSMDRLVEAFSLDRISKSGARFDQDKMKWFNQTYIRATANEDLLPLVKAELADGHPALADDEKLLQVIELLKERVSFIPDFASQAGFFFNAPDSYDERMVQKSWKAENKGYISALRERWASLDTWSTATLHDAFEAMVAEKEISNGAVLAPLRLVLTGKPAGPGAFDIAGVIGREETLARMDKAVNNLAVAE